VYVLNTRTLEVINVHKTELKSLYLNTVNLKTYWVVFYHCTTVPVANDHLEARVVSHMCAYRNRLSAFLCQATQFLFSLRHPHNEKELLVLSWIWWESTKVIKEIYDFYWRIASIVHVPLLPQGRIIYKYKGQPPFIP